VGEVVGWARVAAQRSLTAASTTTTVLALNGTGTVAEIQAVATAKGSDGSGTAGADATKTQEPGAELETPDMMRVEEAETVACRLITGWWQRAAAARI
jgi:hypothetical protein